MQQIIQMKIEQLIVQYLFKNKKVKLQDIGEFTFVSDSNEAGEDSTQVFFPEGTIHFKFDLKTEQDDDLINYIMSQTGKIRPLAASDLESYSILGKQFLNIGKTLFFKDLGALQKNQNNEYTFVQGALVALKMDSSLNANSYTEQSEKLISFASPIRKKSIKNWVAPLVLISMVVILIIVFFFQFFSIKETSQPIFYNINKKDSLVSNQQPIKDSLHLRIVINEFKNKETAQKNLLKLLSQKPSVAFTSYTSDSINFKIGFPITSPMYDTSRLIDSIRLEYGSKSYIDTP